ncbi:MAG: NAD(P)/FAD-dependent oxidoreductase [Lentisphaeria bacterium]|nr:NAD(P)/FAD-dependent oxidoreductase [Lentisphaeria bacterium]
MKEILLTGLRLSARGTAAGLEKRLRDRAAGMLALPVGELGRITVLGRSTDARGREPLLAFKLAVEVPDACPLPAWERPPVPVPELPEAPKLKNPVVVGTGPAGIFCALALAMAGTDPVIIDRGPEIGKRTAGVDRFLRTRELDENCNLLVGEGGAGTFSDGKLYTGTRDGMAAFVLHTLAEAGAPPEILVLARPHIGTDYLKIAASGLRRKIESLGGRFLFGAHVTGIAAEGDRCTGVTCADGSVITAPAAVIACGLGGRELARGLTEKIGWEPKPFQIGCRIEHPQDFIDRRQYHGPRPELLGAAEYHLVSRPAGNILPVSSFCMCPGGTVVNASAWRGHCATNGMSDFSRSGKFANACLITTMPPLPPGEAFGLIENIERGLFALGGSDYTIPAQDASAFLRNEKRLRDRETSCVTGIAPGSVRALLPEAAAKALTQALLFFDRQLPGFIRYGKIIGAEPCVSSPLRFLRGPDGASTIGNCFLAGEGAGAAGGIVSAACDGLRTARNLLLKYA